MKRKVRVAQYGCGKMSKYLMQYVLDKGAELVAAFDMNPEIIGKDVSSVIGCDPVGVKISPADEADAILKATKPDRESGGKRRIHPVLHVESEWLALQ